MTHKYVARAIICKGNAVLLGQRSRGLGAGQYALIGGKPDAGETMEEALIREVFEELGAELRDVQLFKEELGPNTEPDIIWHASYFTGMLEGEIRLNEDEISRVVFVGEKDLEKYDIAFGHERILKEFFRKRK